MVCSFQDLEDDLDNFDDGSSAMEDQGTDDDGPDDLMEGSRYFHHEPSIVFEGNKRGRVIYDLRVNHAKNGGVIFNSCRFITLSEDDCVSNVSLSSHETRRMKETCHEYFTYFRPSPQVSCHFQKYGRYRKILKGVVSFRPTNRLTRSTGLIETSVCALISIIQ